MPHEQPWLDTQTKEFFPDICARCKSVPHAGWHSSLAKQFYCQACAKFLNRQSILTHGVGYNIFTRKE